MLMFWLWRELVCGRGFGGGWRRGCHLACGSEFYDQINFRSMLGAIIRESSLTTDSSRGLIYLRNYKMLEEHPTQQIMPQQPQLDLKALGTGAFRD